MTGRKVDIFGTIFFPNIYAMSPTYVNFAHRLDKFALLVENEN